MAEDSSLLPAVENPPGTASIIGDTTKGVALDYSDHLDRLVTALDQISISMALMAEHTQNMSDNIENRLVPAVETLTAKISAIETYQKKMKELGEGDGIHMIGPYEWLSMYAIYKLLVDQGVTDFNSIKSQIDSLPKNF